MHGANHNLNLATATRPTVWHRRARRFITVIFLLICLGWLAWAERVSLLRGAANLWIVSDPVTSAEVAVVLGGGMEVRPFAAADLYRRGLVRKILVSQVPEERVVKMGVVRGHTESNRQILLSLGVPAQAIETFGTSNRNTKEEALALRKWATQHPVHTVIIPVELFVARRVRWMFRHEFAGQGMQIEVSALDPPVYTRADWWTTERGIVEFQNEILKYIYYRLRY